jgi:archaellum component FlaG (FlaF/FlaG flagellin family)
MAYPRALTRSRIVAAAHDGTLTTDTVSLLSIVKLEVKGATHVAITTVDNKTLTLTPGHHVPVGAACCLMLKQAKDIEIGEKMWAVKDGKATATTVTTKTAFVKATGLHSPVLTNGGFPVVDGFVTSFDSIDKVTLAKHGLAPLLKACKATGTCENFRDMFFSADDRAYIASP